jgi:hypothetical protein
MIFSWSMSAEGLGLNAEGAMAMSPVALLGVLGLEPRGVRERFREAEKERSIDFLAAGAEPSTSAAVVLISRFVARG